MIIENLEEYTDAALTHLSSALLELAGITGHVQAFGITPNSSVAWALLLDEHINEGLRPLRARFDAE